MENTILNGSVGQIYQQIQSNLSGKSPNRVFQPTAFKVLWTY